MHRFWGRGEFFYFPDPAEIVEPSPMMADLTVSECKICVPTYCYFGGMFPQQSCPPDVLVDASTSMGKYLYLKNIFGYVGVEFLVWYDLKTVDHALLFPNLDDTKTE